MTWEKPIEKLEQEFIKTTIETKFDVITFDLRLYTDTFVMPRYRLEGYKFIKRYPKHRIVPYKPSWLIDKFINEETGNPIFYLASDKVRDKNRKTFYMVKIDFHGEKTPLTSKEINQFLDVVKRHYQEFASQAGEQGVLDKRILVVPQPVLSKVEVALDFSGIDSSLLLNNVSGNLYKMRCKKMWQVGGIADESIEIDGVEQNDVATKPEPKVTRKYTFDGRVLTSAYPTNYLSNTFREYTYMKGEKDYYRFEVILNRAYLKRKSIESTDDLQKFNHVQYWTEHFFFFRLNKDKVMEIVRKKKPEWEASARLLLKSESVLSSVVIFSKLKAQKRHDSSRLFGYASRQLLITIWHTFDGMIQEALSKLSLTEGKVQEQFEPMQRKRDKAPARKGRRSKETDIQVAIVKLHSQGIKPTYKEIARVASVSEKTIAKHKHLLKE